MTVLPFLRRDIPVKEEEEENKKSRSVELPIGLWDMVEKDAKRCRRSVTKQIEAILALYYRIESSVNIDEEVLTSTHDAESHKPRLKKTA